jgi:predicted nucleic acid-binding protein
MVSNSSDGPRRPKPPVLDTVVLHAFGFGHPDGIETLLRVLQTEQARLPAEVYNADEDALPPGEDDEDLSELARGIRYARRQVRSRPPAEGERYRRWIEHAAQIEEHLKARSLTIDPLQVGELPDREALIDDYGIGRGEAACLVLAQRYGATAVFVSSDEEACQVAENIGVPQITIPEVLETWVNVFCPSVADFDDIVEGLRHAKFDPGEAFSASLRERLR